MGIMNNHHGYSETDIRDRISQFIRDNFLLGDKNKNLDVHVSLYETRIVDSTGVLEIVDFLEETFQITIGDEELIPDNLDSIMKMVHFVQRKLEHAS
jgi:acyl carrier protein